MEKTNENKLIKNSIIQSAIEGDKNALKGLLKHFEPYILSLANEKHIASDGTVHHCVNDGMKKQLEKQLIKAIGDFKVDEQ